MDSPDGAYGHRLWRPCLDQRRSRMTFLLWDDTSTGWVVVASGASLPLARVAWFGFLRRGELPEILDLLLQLDHLEFTLNSQPLELL